MDSPLISTVTCLVTPLARLTQADLLLGLTVLVVALAGWQLGRAVPALALAGLAGVREPR